MRLKSGLTDKGPANDLIKMFNSVEFVCKEGGNLYFVDNFRVIRGAVFIDGFLISGHKCTDPGIEQLPVFKPNVGLHTVELVAEAVNSGKMLQEALTIAVELSL